MKKLLLSAITIFLLLTGAVATLSCDNNEIDTNSLSVPDSEIIGIWELKTLRYGGDDIDLPSEQRDVYRFYYNGKVKVILKTKGFTGFPKEDGEYDYSYDKEKQMIKFEGEKARKCIISDGKMYIDGYHEAYKDGITEFIFTTSTSPSM